MIVTTCNLFYTYRQLNFCELGQTDYTLGRQAKLSVQETAAGEHFTIFSNQNSVVRTATHAFDCVKAKNCLRGLLVIC